MKEFFKNRADSAIKLINSATLKMLVSKNPISSYCCMQNRQIIVTESKPQTSAINNKKSNKPKKNSKNKSDNEENALEIQIILWTHFYEFL